MVKLICQPASAAAEALAREGASRLVAIDPRLGSLLLSIEGMDARERINGIAAHLELRLPEHQLILNRCHPSDPAAAVREAFDAAAAWLLETSSRDFRQPTAVPAGNRQPSAAMS